MKKLQDKITLFTQSSQHELVSPTFHFYLPKIELPVSQGLVRCLHIYG